MTGFQWFAFVGLPLAVVALGCAAAWLGRHLIEALDALDARNE